MLLWWTWIDGWKYLGKKYVENLGEVYRFFLKALQCNCWKNINIKMNTLGHWNPMIQNKTQMLFLFKYSSQKVCELWNINVIDVYGGYKQGSCQFKSLVILKMLTLFKHNVIILCIRVGAS